MFWQLLPPSNGKKWKKRAYVFSLLVKFTSFLAFFASSLSSKTSENPLFLCFLPGLPGLPVFRFSQWHCENDFCTHANMANLVKRHRLFLGEPKPTRLGWVGY
jgi:hypothetical protein